LLRRRTGKAFSEYIPALLSDILHFCVIRHFPNILDISEWRYKVNRNVGGIDKGLRLVLGIVLVLAGLLAPLGDGVRIVVFIVAAIALFTGTFGF
jgi:hypothetical protein